MGKNTPGRQDFIIENLRVEKDTEKELIGYYLTNMIVEMKDVHSSHVSKKEVPEAASTDTYITIGIGANRDELYD
jgi:hypothetical protein